MKRFAEIAALTVVLMASASCSRTDQTGARAPETSAPAATGEGLSSGHAAGVLPGSYEDWCDKHQVPETMCTRCDPDLKIVRPPKPEVQG